MCYQERRWHTICNHTIQARFECPRRCAQYSADIDVVETQLPAYCLACRRHVDSLGMVAALARCQSNSKRHSRAAAAPLTLQQQQQQQQEEEEEEEEQKPSPNPGARMLTGSSSVDSLRLAAAPNMPLPETPRRRPSTSASASASELHRSLSERSREASLGMIMSGFSGAQGRQRKQQQQQTRDEPEGKTGGNRPVMLSPSPQKPLLSLRIPEDVAPQPADPKSPSSDGLSLLSTPSTTIISEEVDPMALAARTPITPWTPPSTSTSFVPARAPPAPAGPLDELPSKEATASLPRPGPSPRLTTIANLGGSGGVGGVGSGGRAGGARQALSSGSKSLLRRSRSASRLVFGGGTVLFSARPQLVEIASPRRANFPGCSSARTSSSSSSLSTTTTTSASASASPAPGPRPSGSGSASLSNPQAALPSLLQRSKSTRTLADASPSPEEQRRAAGGREEEVGAAPPARMRIRNPSAKNLFPPPSPASRSLIDIHDPEWLSRHGLKWDAHGLGIVSTAVS